MKQKIDTGETGACTENFKLYFCTRFEFCFKYNEPPIPLVLSASRLSGFFLLYAQKCSLAKHYAKYRASEKEKKKQKYAFAHAAV